MATSPSKRFEDGVLVERAISTPMSEGEPEVNEDLTQRPYKEPDRSTMADRANAGAKAVSSSTTENKAAKTTKATKK